MTSISLEVRDFLKKNPFILKGIYYKIINVSALAVHILKQTKMDASLDAVMSGIRRYEKEFKGEEKRRKYAYEVYRNSRISTKSRLVLIEVKRHFKVLSKIIPEILGLLHVSKGDVLRIIEGRESILFLVDHSKKDEILSKIPKDELIAVTPNLGEINIRFSEKYGDMPGLIGPVTNEIALNNINIIQTVGGMPELLFIIKEKDISQCHDIILRFFYQEGFKTG